MQHKRLVLTALIALEVAQCVGSGWLFWERRKLAAEGREVRREIRDVCRVALLQSRSFADEHESKLRYVLDQVEEWASIHYQPGLARALAEASADLRDPRPCLLRHPEPLAELVRPREAPRHLLPHSSRGVS